MPNDNTKKPNSGQSNTVSCKPKTENIPESLKQTPRWVAWRLELRHGQKKPTKVPVDAKSGRFASTTDPTTWATFKEALSFAERAYFDKVGVGFVFDGSGDVGVDLDGCRDPKTGRIDKRAQEIIDKLDSYVEVSPSGTGLHIIVKGILPGSRRRCGKVEMYDTARYFTFTGLVLNGCRKTIEKRDRQLADVYRCVFEKEQTEKKGVAKTKQKAQRTSQSTSKKSRGPLSDDKLINVAINAANGENFQRLYSGDWSRHTSESEATLGLLMMLAFWTKKDPSQMDRLFRKSGLMRPKWDSKRGNSTWGVNEIDTAIAETTETFSNRPAITDFDVQSVLALAKQDPEKVFTDEVLQWTCVLEASDSGRFIRLRSGLKGVGVPIGQWEKALRKISRRTARQSGDGPQYYERDDKTYLRKFTSSGVVDTLLANFTGRIVEDVVVDDGVEQKRHLKIVARQAQRKHENLVSIEDFSRKDWGIDLLGASAVLSA